MTIPLNVFPMHDFSSVQSIDLYKAYSHPFEKKNQDLDLLEVENQTRIVNYSHRWNKVAFFVEKLSN